MSKKITAIVDFDVNDDVWPNEYEKPTRATSNITQCDYIQPYDNAGYKCCRWKVRHTGPHWTTFTGKQAEQDSWISKSEWNTRYNASNIPSFNKFDAQKIVKKIDIWKKLEDKLKNV